MDALRYQQYWDDIKYCADLQALESLVQGILQPTGFGENGDSQNNLDVGLNYQEIAECLLETDRQHFQKEIELLIFANQQLDLIRYHQVPERPPQFNPWELFT